MDAAARVGAGAVGGMMVAVGREVGLDVGTVVAVEVDVSVSCGAGARK